MKKLKDYLLLIAIWLLVRLGIFSLIEKFYFNTSRIARTRHGAIPVLDKTKVDHSYLLFSPFFTRSKKVIPGKIYLTDVFGTVLHVWRTPYQCSNARLARDGSLHVTLLKPDDPHGPRTVSGQTGIIQKLSWDGVVLKEYALNNIHHDFFVRDNGNILVTRFGRISDNLAQRVLEGVNGREVGRPVIADTIVEINEDGKSVWEWKSEDHLDPDIDVFSQAHFRTDWTHTNSIRQIESNPIDGTESILLSMRNTNRVLIVRKQDGEILWRSPAGMFFGQHDASLLNNGNILVFDNGLHKNAGAFPDVLYSRVVELNPLDNEIVWECSGGTERPTDMSRFFTSSMGSVQRLRNGNTHMALGSSGHVIEVTSDREVVLDFVSPFRSRSKIDIWPHTSCFRVERYYKDELDWPEKLPDPVPKRIPYVRQIYDVMNSR